MGFAIATKAQSAWAWVKQHKAFDQGMRAQAGRAWVQKQTPFTAVQGNGHPILHMHGVVSSETCVAHARHVASAE